MCKSGAEVGLTLYIAIFVLDQDDLQVSDVVHPDWTRTTGPLDRRADMAHLVVFRELLQQLKDSRRLTLSRQRRPPAPGSSGLMRKQIWHTAPTKSAAFRQTRDSAS